MQIAKQNTLFEIDEDVNELTKANTANVAGKKNLLSIIFLYAIIKPLIYTK